MLRLRSLAALSVLLASAAAANVPAAAQEAEADSIAAPATERGTFDAPGWVMLRSGLIPGWGQAKNGKWLKALFVVGLEGLFFERLWFEYDRIDYYRERAHALPADEEAKRAYYWSKVERHRMHRRDYIWWTSLVVLLAMGDAFVDAHLRDFDVDLQYQTAPEGPDDAGQGSTSMRLSLGRRF